MGLLKLASRRKNKDLYGLMQNMKISGLKKNNSE